MKIHSIRMQNFRSFVDSGVIQLAQINVVIGRNNAGKSSILRGLHQIQHGVTDLFGDVRAGTNRATIRLNVIDANGPSYWGQNARGLAAAFEATLSTSNRRDGSLSFELTAPGLNASGGDFRFPNVEPDHFVVPYLSKRKAASYAEDTREQIANAITSDVSNLAAKLARIGNPGFPKHLVYVNACKSILGFLVTAIPSVNGQRPGTYLPDGSSVWIDQMGEGVPNIVQLLVSLATSEGKLFLLEEPENDLHPAALKALLDLVVESAKVNQFVVSTHSNIVVRHLCSATSSKLLRVVAEPNVLPTTARVEVVEATPEARIAVLEDLGYSFADFEMWDGWLILEEASAERVIRDYLIPWFAPSLRRVRTLAAGGVDKVEPVFADFQRMVLYTHLMPAYAGRTWVRVDGDQPGRELTERLKSDFRDWPSDRFRTFAASQFENYYPAPFADEVKEVLATADRQVRRQAKRNLLNRVLAWLEEDEQRGRVALSESAGEVIADLRDIEAQLKSSFAPS